MDVGVGIRFSVRFQFGSSVFERNSVLRKWEPIGSQKFLEPNISVFGYFGSVSVLTELTELFRERLRWQ